MNANNPEPTVPPEPIEPIVLEPEPELESDASVSNYSLEDRIGAFAPSILASDALEMREIVQGFFERVKPEAWSRRTERRPKGWTLHETLAHLDAVTAGFVFAMEESLSGREVLIAGLSKRTDLPQWNREQIAARAATEPQILCNNLLGSLSTLARLSGSLSQEQTLRLVDSPMYGSQITIAELAGGALSHIGIVHAAQVAQGARSQPLWLWFRPAMFRRQLTRFFHIMGLAYWPERGGNLHATIAFHAVGVGGGSWYIRVTPSGGYGRIGRVRTADLQLSFASTDLLCRAITAQINPLWYVARRKIKLQGNLRLAGRFPRYFIPT